MVVVREPVLHPIAIIDLRPTQITVGMREVQAKQKSWQASGARKKVDFLERHMIPVIRGPKDRLYIIDHHHLSLALHNEGVTSVQVIVVANLHTLEEDEFWTFLDHRSLMHAYDATGERCGIDKIPSRITGLKDDPYRSLAGELRRRGGYAKDTTPFSEFLWADFMRRRVSKSLVKNDFAKALKQALRLAKSDEAAHLPGWCGPHSD